MIAIGGWDTGPVLRGEDRSIVLDYMQFYPQFLLVFGLGVLVAHLLVRALRR